MMSAMPTSKPPQRSEVRKADTRRGLLIFCAGTLAAGAAPVEVGEEGVSHGLLQAQALGGVVLHHLLNQVKQLLVVLVLGQHVVLKGRQWPLETRRATRRNGRLSRKEQPKNKTLKSFLECTAY